VSSVYTRHHKAFCSRCQILDGSVYYGGSGKNWHFAIYVRTPDWKPEFTGTIFAIIPVTAETLGSINACILRVCPTKNACMLLFHDRARRNICMSSQRISQTLDRQCCRVRSIWWSFVWYLKKAHEDTITPMISLWRTSCSRGEYACFFERWNKDCRERWQLHFKISMPLATL
jgi:hypothetical protein